MVLDAICGTLSHCQATFTHSQAALLGHSLELQVAACSLSYTHDSQALHSILLVAV